MSLTIALIAHDAKKPALADWAARHSIILGKHRIICTATTGSVIGRLCPDLKLELVKSGPMGGDQQIGAMIAGGTVDVLIFFPDPLTPHPHDVDVKALLRLSLVYDIPSAFNPRTADLLVDAGLFGARGKRNKT